jgi:hypothetical protein
MNVKSAVSWPAGRQRRLETRAKPESLYTDEARGGSLFAGASVDLSASLWDTPTLVLL